MKRSLTLVFILLSSFRVFSQAPASLSLPFFDDFAKYRSRLDTTKWMPGSSVYVNDHFSNNPVSKNVATFNGISATGIVSQSNSISSTGIDTLISRPINLAGRVASDSVYLSFYLQTGGIGKSRTFSSFYPIYFEVEFKNNSGTWLPVSRILPGSNSQRNLDFKQFYFAITDAQFLHSNFQFRFRTFGKQTLSDDTWNLDYVVLGAGRSKLESRFDLTLSRRLPPLLRRYTAMPIHQFNANIAGELSDTIYTTINNYEKQPRPVFVETSFRINNGPQVAITRDTIAIIQETLQRKIFQPKPSASVFSGLSGFQNITSIVALDTREPLTNPETLLNDSISRITRLHDYYAYDDGSAESFKAYLFLTSNTGHVAQKFDLNIADRVKSISVFIPKAGNVKNTQVTFRLWNVAANGAPDGTGIFSQTFVVPDISQLDNWFEIPVNPSVPVSGGFYAGWFIAGRQPFYVGLDDNKNTELRHSAFGTSWSAESKGTIMLRVALNNNITGLSETFAAQKTKLYPNPATDHVLIEGKFESVRLLSSTGQLLLEQKGNGTVLRLETQNLKPGFYLVQVQSQNRIETHKLIIQPN